MVFESETPPGPPKLPLLGNTPEIVRGQGDFLERTADKYGPVASIRMIGIGDIILVTAPDLVEEVLRSNTYQKAAVAREVLSDLLGEGLLLAEGERWSKHRQLVQPAFSPSQIQSYAEIMTAQSREFVDSLSHGRVYDVEDQMRRLTFRILLDTIFGADIDYEQWALREAFKDILAPGRPLNQPIAYAVPKWVPIPLWRRYNRAIEHFESVVGALIDQARGGAEERDDLLSALVTATEDDERLSHEELRDEVMTMLFAGHETTATALTFALYLLGKHPEVERRVVHELESELADAPPTAADVQDLTYVERVIKEALRLYPPVPALGREPKTAVELGGYHIEPGTTIALSQWVVHRDSAQYENPRTFDPGRWERTPESQRHTFAYFPFGGGPRQCIGEDFAMIEAKLVLATLLQSYRFELVSDEPLDPSVSIVTKPTRDIEIIPRQR